MELREKVKCPYCGHAEDYDVSDLMTLAVCPRDEVCGKWFVIEREIEVKVIAKKIEGED